MAPPIGHQLRRPADRAESDSPTVKFLEFPLPGINKKRAPGVNLQVLYHLATIHIQYVSSSTYILEQIYQKISNLSCKVFTVHISLEKTWYFAILLIICSLHFQHSDWFECVCVIGKYSNIGNYWW